jgi:hypothetical protein
VGFGGVGLLFVILYTAIPVAILWYVIFTATRAGVRAAMRDPEIK